MWPSVSARCPFCRKSTALSPAPLNVHGIHGLGAIQPLHILAGNPHAVAVHEPCDGVRWWIGQCHACLKLLLVEGPGRKIFPTVLPAPVAAEILDPMRADLVEAKQCQVVGAHNAAVVMARRALQCAAIHQGAPRKRGDGRDAPLCDQLKWLRDNGHITKRLLEAGEAVRWVGNHGAHDTEPEIRDDGTPTITDVTKDDAEAAIQLAEEICRALYVLPDMAKEQLAKRKPKP